MLKRWMVIGDQKLAGASLYRSGKAKVKSDPGEARG